MIGFIIWNLVQTEHFIEHLEEDKLPHKSFDGNKEEVFVLKPY